LVIFERLAAALRAARPVALVTRLDGAFAGAKLLVFADESFGDLGSAGLTYAATGEARALLAAGETSQRTFGEDGEPVGMDVRLFIQAFATKPDMYIFGAIDFSRAMARIGSYLGFTVTVIDARPIFATKARLPDADRVVVAWPDEFLRGAPVDDRTALIVLTHDVKFDIPLLEVALRTNAGYIGAMGSRRTHANRVAELRRSGTSDADLARINAPIGLDLGARTPEETAIAIAAEIIALREHRRGGRLSENGLPVHNERGRAHAATESS
jgi:xanthine dehydrogenase accessory factor